MGEEYCVLSETSFLYPRPTFLGGFASVLDWGDTLTEFNRSLNGQQADGLAIRSDWHTTGHDLMEALRRYRELLEAEKEPTR